jgi:Caudovirus prohead serine protease
MNTTAAFRRPPATQTRFAAADDLTPSSYDKASRTVECVISLGSPVKRYFGTETLRIHPDAVKLDRMKSSGIPLLDSHHQVGLSNHLGRFVDTWITSGTKPALMGRIAFDDTPEGRRAEGMVARREIAGISAGYRVNDWEIKDADGRVIDPEVDRIRWDDDDLTYTATNWELFEASIVSVPADNAAVIRSLGSGADRALHPDAFVRSFGSSPPIGAAAASATIERMIALQLAAVVDNLDEFSEQPELGRRRRYSGQFRRIGRA